MSAKSINARRINRFGANAPGEKLMSMYAALLSAYGPQGWWPARNRFEVILGAILTQNTSWKNVELALQQLRKAGGLSPKGLQDLNSGRISLLIRSSGFHRQKAQTIRRFLDFLEREFSNSLTRMFRTDTEVLRAHLLQIRGVGSETADAILLYAGRQPYFVTDTYSRRVAARHALLPPGSSYRAAQDFFHSNLERDHLIYNEYHALLVEVGKKHCGKSAPKCYNCPLEAFLPPGGPRNT